MKNRKDRLDNFCCIDGFIKSTGDLELIDKWDRLSVSDMLSLSDAVKYQARNKALIEAADTFPSGIKTHTKALYLLAHIEEFNLLKLPEIEAGKNPDLIPLEKSLYAAHKSGSETPKSVTQIYNILKESY